jgi:hypothetical protein
MKLGLIINLICFCLLKSIFFSQESIIIARLEKGLENLFYVNERGEALTGNKFKYLSEYSKDGFARCQIKIGEREVFLNLKGEIIDPFAGNETNYEINEFYEFSSGMVRYRKSASGDPIYGYMDTNFKIIHEAVFVENAHPFNSDYSTARDNKSYYILYKDGTKRVLRNDIIKIGPVKEKFFFVEVQKGGFGFMNQIGDFIAQPIYESVGNFSGGLAWVRLDGKLGFIDTSGTMVIKPNFSNVTNFDPVSRIARVKDSNEKFCFINEKGEILNCKFDVDKCSKFSNGFATFREGKNEGLMNAKFETVIEPLYDNIKEWSEKHVIFVSNKNFGIMTTKGEVICEPKFDLLKGITSY